MTPLQLAGLNPDASALLLPAATTKTAPAALMSLTAVCSAVEHGPDPPKLRFSTLAGLALAGTPVTGKPAAQRAPSRISDKDPPHLPSTRTGRILDVQLMPPTPTLLLVAAPIVPATWVPCQELSLVCPPGAGSAQPVKKPFAAVPSSSVAVIQSPGSEGSGSRPSPSFAERKTPGLSSDTKS